MPFSATYLADEPTRDDIDHGSGPVVLEFGANWCGYCQALSPALERVLSEHPEVQHVRVADGRGKPLGRSFRVKLWPTIVLLRDGQVIEQLVRPTAAELEAAFARFVEAT